MVARAAATTRSIERGLTRMELGQTAGRGDSSGRRGHSPAVGAHSSRLRVLHLSDLHYVPGQLDKLRFLKGLAALEPDLVVCTGDLLADDTGLDELTGALAGLLARPGIFVFGSNDYFAAVPANPLRYLRRRHEHRFAVSEGAVPQDWQTLRAVLRQAGWTDLTNARAQLRLVGRLVEFRGTDDAHIGQDDYTAVAGPPSPGVDLSVGVTHAQYRQVLDAMCADGLPLIFAGHTHGGQVCLPKLGALVANCDLDRRLASGLHRYTPVGESGAAEMGARTAVAEEAGESATGARIAPVSTTGGAWLHVSAGLGTSPYAPYRLFCRPEACLLEVVLPE